MNAQPARALDRALLASGALVLAVATATGVFVTKIARSYAAPSSSTGDTNPLGNTDQGGLTGGFGSGQLSQPQDQPPAGRSHGS